MCYYLFMTKYVNYHTIKFGMTLSWMPSFTSQLAVTKLSILCTTTRIIARTSTWFGLKTNYWTEAILTRKFGPVSRRMLIIHCCCNFLSCGKRWKDNLPSGSRRESLTHWGTQQWKRLDILLTCTWARPEQGVSLYKPSKPRFRFGIPRAWIGSI